MAEITLKDVFGIYERAKFNAMNISSEDGKKVTEYAQELENIGSDLLSNKDEKTLNSALSLIEAAITAKLISDGDLELAMILLTNPQEFSVIVASAMKMSVGIAIQEEWR